MKSQYVCRACDSPDKGRVNETEKCSCGGVCQEELTTGEIVLRVEIPEYVKRDLVEIEKENTKLMNEFLMNSERYFMAGKGLQVNIDRRVQLQNKMQKAVQGGMRKVRLHKDKDVRWGYDSQRKQFFGLKKPVSKVIKEGK